jgi:signal recognition particle subunit SRP54
MHCDRAPHRSLARAYPDIDFVTDKAGALKLEPFVASLGYTPNKTFNTLSGDHRQLYYDNEKNRQIDIFIGDFHMCHHIPLAGRLHVDEDMMREVEAIKAAVRPHEILFVVDAMTGQDAVNTAQAFHERLGFDGAVLTKMDGDARGGAALSLRATVGKPIKFIGVGEKPEALERFHPDRMASRILGMGDIVTLVEKAQDRIDEDRAVQFERKLRQSQFTFEDFLEQMQDVRSMGPLDQLVGMIPGMQRLPQNVAVDERALARIEAIIRSMTPEERQRPQVINGSRRKRIAAGSGTTVQDVNRLLKQFEQMQKMMKAFGKGGKFRRGMRLPAGI